MNRLLVISWIFLGLVLLPLSQGFAASGENGFNDLPVEIQEQVVSRVQDPLGRHTLRRHLNFRIPAEELAQEQEIKNDFYIDLNDVVRDIFGQNGFRSIDQLQESGVKERFQEMILRLAKSQTNNDQPFSSIIIIIDRHLLLRSLQFSRNQAPGKVLEVAINSLLTHLGRAFDNLPDDQARLFLFVIGLTFFNSSPPLMQGFSPSQISLPPFFVDLPRLKWLGTSIDFSISPGSIERVIEKKPLNSVKMSVLVNPDYIPKLGKLLTKKGYSCIFYNKDERLECTSSNIKHPGIIYEHRDIWAL